MHKYLGILEAEDIKHKEIKEKTRKEYFRRVKIILNSKLNWGGGGGEIRALLSGKTVKYAIAIIESASKYIYQKSACINKLSLEKK